MFAYLAEKISALFADSFDRNREAFLASSSDLADLERRMRLIETDGHSCRPDTNLTSRDRDF